MSTKPIKQMSINSPLKDICTAEHFVKFILLPQYKSMCETWNKYNIKLSILLYKDSEDIEFFEKVNNYLKWYCPELIGNYILIRKD